MHQLPDAVQEKQEDRTSSLSLWWRWLQRSKKEWPPMTHSFWMRLWNPVLVRQWASIITCTREERRQQRSEAFSSNRRTFTFCASRHSVISIAFFRQRLIISSQLLLSKRKPFYVCVPKFRTVIYQKQLLKFTVCTLDLLQGQEVA